MRHLHLMYCDTCKRIMHRIDGKTRVRHRCYTSYLTGIATILLYKNAADNNKLVTDVKYMCPNCKKEVSTKLVDGAYKLLYHSHCKLGHKLPTYQELQ